MSCRHARGCGHDTNDGHCRARDAEVLSFADINDGFNDAAARAAVILGHAIGGRIQGAKVGVVDYDRGSQALKIHEAFNAIAVNIRTFTTIRIRG